MSIILIRYGYFVTLFYLACMVLVKCAYSFDVMTALWNAYGTIKGNMNNFVNSIKEAHGNSIYIEKFIHFMEIENSIVSNKSLKNNADTPVSIEFVDVSFSYDGGVVFSGGQKLALARVLLSNKRTAILDEPSSALDPKAESEFNELVFRMLTERTMVIISHRLSTTKMADRVILIQNGRVAEDGSHDELMKNGGTYAEMFEMQSRRYQS